MNIYVFKSTLQKWMEECGEVLLDIYLPHSGGSGDFYLLNSPGQIEDCIILAESMAKQSGDGRAIITGFRSGYYPLHGIVVGRMCSILSASR